MWQECNWNQEDYMALRQYLFTLKDEKYKSFHEKLVPTADKDRIIGIRLPFLRQIAKEIGKGNPLAFLKSPSHEYYEETMVWGLVIGYLKEDAKTVAKHLSAFIPYIDNWAICDSCVSGLKIVKKNKKEFYAIFNEYLNNQSVYSIRVAVVALMDYYTTEEYIDDVLKIYDGISYDDYYVKMAVAWGISVAYIKEKAKTMVFLKDNRLDNFTYNKALQKIVESNRVSKEEKDEIRKMKRK